MGAKKNTVNDLLGQTPQLRILIIDDEPNTRKTLAIALEADGHQVAAVGTMGDALSAVQAGFFDLALVDLRLGSESGMDLITALRTACPSTKAVVMTAYGSVDSAVEAMHRGAFDYLPKPFTRGEMRMLVQKVAEVRALERQVETF